MRLLRLYLGDYRVLRDLDIRFGPPGAEGVSQVQGTSYGLDFLVGINSTGKSTVLRAIADLVRKLERHAPILYPFELEYELGSPDQRRRVKLSNRPDDLYVEAAPPVESLRLWVDGVVVPQLSGDILPQLVVAFTTGSEAEWELLDEAEVFGAADPSAIRDLSSVDWAIRELPGKPVYPEAMEERSSTEESRFLLVRAWQLPLVTLCGLLTDMAEEEQSESRRLRKVLEEAKIGPFRGFSLKFRMHQGTTSVADREVVRLLAKYHPLKRYADRCPP